VVHYYCYLSGKEAKSYKSLFRVLGFAALQGAGIKPVFFLNAVCGLEVF
jgi:hypothetical protein